MKKAILILLIISSLKSYAQQIVKGVVLDETEKALPFAVVALLHDSLLMASFQTEENGVFELQTIVTHDSFLLRIYYVGYQPFVQKVALPKDTLQLGFIHLTPLSNVLSEAVIIGQRDPIQVNGDTTSFTASAFRTQPNAVAEDLIKKLPSVEIEKNGTIRAKGETVKQVLVNGKPYFGNDPQVALQNFPAEAIESVQIFEKRSEQADFSGIDNGEREMTINIIIKSDYNRRIAAKINGGGGTKGRFVGRANFNRFTETQKLTVLASGNNINKTGFSQDDFSAFLNNPTAANPSNNIAAKGFQETQSGGFNFIDNWQKKSELNISYFINNKNTFADKTTFRQNFLPTSFYTSRGKSMTTNGNTNQRLNGYFDQKIDSFTSLRFSFNTTWNASKWGSTSESENWRGDTARQSNSNRNAYTEGGGLGLTSNLLLKRRLQKAGRTVSLNLSYNRNDAQRYNRTTATTNFYALSTGLRQRTDFINQIDDRENDRNNYVTTLSYTEPLRKKWLFEVNYRYSLALSKAQRQVDSVGQNAERYFKPQFSTVYNSDFSFHQAGFNMRYNVKKLNFSTGIQAQNSILSGVFGSVQENLRTKYAYILPNIRLNWQIPPFKTQNNRLNLNYEPFVREPSVEQLQPTQDFTDPQNIFIGNPRLQPEYTHRVKLVYTSFQKKTNAYFNANLNFLLTNHKIVNSVSIDTLFRRITQPINIDNQYFTTDGNMSFGFRRWQQRLRFSWVSNFTQSQGINPINNVFNLTKRWSISGSPHIELNFQDTFEFILRSTLRYNETKYSIQTNFNQEFWTQEYEAEMTASLPFDMRLNGVFEYNIFTSNILGIRQGVPILNLALIKYLDKRRWELRLVVVDVLNRNTGIQQWAEANYVQQEITRSLGRYALLSATYSFNRGEKNKHK